MKFIKPNGTEVETNGRPDTIARAQELGWKTPEQLEAEAKAAEEAEAEQEADSTTENSVTAPSDMKVDDLRAELTDRGIEFPSDAKTDDLIKLVTEAREQSAD